MAARRDGNVAWRPKPVVVMLNDEKAHFTVSDVLKAPCEVFDNGGLVTAYKLDMSEMIGLSIVVKRTKETSELQKDGLDANMQRLGNLHHRNVLAPLAYTKFDPESMIFYKYISNDNLHSVLHYDQGAELNWETRLKILKGIARGLEFLHTELACYDLPHGNLKSRNVILDENYEPLLSDYAFHMLINPDKAPHAMFAYKSPEYIQHQQVSPKSDIYCLGIIILEILTGKLPSQYFAKRTSTDVVEWVSTAISKNMDLAELIDPKISNNIDALDHMVDLLKLGVDCSRTDPEQRPKIREVINRVEKIVDVEVFLKTECCARFRQLLFTKKEKKRNHKSFSWLRTI